MNPRVPSLLSAVIGLAEKTLDRPSGDPRRQDEAERLFEQVAAAKDWPTDAPKRLVNEWTVWLVQMLRRIERLGPLGDRDELSRAMTVGLALLPYVRADLSAAMDVVARGGREAVTR